MPDNKSISALLSSSKSVEVNREQLGKIKCPKPTESHKPVPHLELVETLEDRLKTVMGAKIIKEQFAVRREGSTLFGVITLKYQDTEDGAAAIGLRTSNDRSMSLQFVAGLNVFVCDNMCLRGDMIMLKRMHTRKLNLVEEIDLGLSRFKDHYKLLTDEVAKLHKIKLTTPEAKSMIHDAFVDQQIMPLRYLAEVSREYFKPRHAEFAPRTAWSLHNAFTEVAKQMPMTPRMHATTELGRFLGMSQEKEAA